MKQHQKQSLAGAINGNKMKKEQPDYFHMFIEIVLNTQNVLLHLVEPEKNVEVMQVLSNWLTSVSSTLSVSSLRNKQSKSTGRRLCFCRRTKCFLVSWCKRDNSAKAQKHAAK